MKKGDKVLVSDSYEGPWMEAIFDHQHDNLYFTKFCIGGQIFTRITGYIYCKPIKQTVEEWTWDWLNKERFMCRHGQVTPKGYLDIFNQYYEDRKKWENE